MVYFCTVERTNSEESSCNPMPYPIEIQCALVIFFASGSVHIIGCSKTATSSPDGAIGGTKAKVGGSGGVTSGRGGNSGGKSGSIGNAGAGADAGAGARGNTNGGILRKRYRWRGGEWRRRFGR